MYELRPSQARHLLDTFGGRAIRDWHQCQREPEYGEAHNGCADDGCICRHVEDGIQHYGEYAYAIASVLSAVANMAGDEAMEDAQSFSDVASTVPYDDE